MTASSIDLLGARLTPLTREELLDRIEAAVDRSEKTVLANHNMHSLHFWLKDPVFRAFYEISTYVFIDGMPLIWMARLLGSPVSGRHRVTYLDFFSLLLSRAQANGWRVFHLGGDPATAEALARWVAEKHAGLNFQQHHGYFEKTRESGENREVLARIERFSPHILLVGFGMPLQERWILENYSALQAFAILDAGGIAAYITGRVPTPPRWAGRLGLEWLFRLASEPRRLARRYLVEPWPIVLRFLKHLTARALR